MSRLGLHALSLLSLTKSLGHPLNIYIYQEVKEKIAANFTRYVSISDSDSLKNNGRLAASLQAPQQLFRVHPCLEILLLHERCA
jgi:hypothetical protein